MEKIDIGTLKKELHASLEAGEPAMVWGPGGIGKSDAVKQVSKAYGGGFVDFRANLREPVDLLGVPSIEDGYTRWNPPSEFPRVPRDQKTGIFFIDELPNAHRATQSALYQLILDRRLGDYLLPPGWRIIAAGNRTQDHGGTFDMPLPLKSRFLHYETEPRHDDWRQWAIRQGVHPQVLSFLNWKPSTLHDVIPEHYSSPTPRTWHKLSNCLHADMDVPFCRLQAAIGQGAATEFQAYSKAFYKLPSAMDVLKNPSLVTPLKDRADALYALNDTVSATTTKKLLDLAVKYMAVLPREFQMLFVKTLMVRNDVLDLDSHPKIDKWIRENAASMWEASEK